MMHGDKAAQACLLAAGVVLFAGAGCKRSAGKGGDAAGPRAGKDGGAQVLTADNPFSRISAPLPLAEEKLSPEDLADQSLIVNGVLDCPVYGSGGFAVTLTAGSKDPNPLAIGVFRDTKEFQFKAPKVLAGKKVYVSGVFDADSSGFVGKPTDKDILLIPDYPEREMSDKGIFGVILKCYNMDQSPAAGKAIKAKMAPIRKDGKMVDYEEMKKIGEYKGGPKKPEEIEKPENPHDYQYLAAPIHGSPYTPPDEPAPAVNGVQEKAMKTPEGQEKTELPPDFKPVKPLPMPDEPVLDKGIEKGK